MLLVVCCDRESWFHNGLQPTDSKLYIMKYIKLVLAVSEKYQEQLIAELFDRDFDSFEQQDDSLVIYVEKEKFTVGDREDIEQLLSAYPGEGYIRSEEIVADQNWNEAWEQTIRPQQVGRFFVKPTWSVAETPEDCILLEIDPKMAFGTGYHESTRLMLNLLPGAVSRGAQVLDAGTGTGILAIASVKLGAEHVLAFDIDQWSITNTQENILLNDVTGKITIEKGSEEVIPEQASYDVILANIERNTILGMLPTLVKVLKKGGDILFSGLLESDREKVLSSMEAHSLTLKNELRENEWIAFHLTH